LSGPRLGRGRREFGAAPCQELPLGGVGRQRDRPLIRGHRLRVPAEPAEQVRSGGGEIRVPGETAVAGEPVDLGEPDVRALGERERGRPVERHHR
jgi:hypothetical protein